MLRQHQRARRASAELDEVTLARAQRGDPDACKTLVLRYQEGVFALLGRMLGPRGLGSQIEDLAQETFLRVFRSLADFDRTGSAKLSTWILCVATRLAINELARKKPQGHERPDALAARAFLVDAAERQELRTRIRQAIGELTPEQQAAFVLREYHGLPEVEIARALGVDVGAVKSRLFRARARLRQALSEVRHG